jgi:putative phosphoesterase
MMKRVAILSDIHGNLPALQAVVDDLARQEIETVITLGDHLSGPLWPLETARFLMRQKWIQIAGNHERQMLDQDAEHLGPSDRYAVENLTFAEMEWLRSLPGMMRIGKNILMFHGAPGNDEVYLLETVIDCRTRPATVEEIKSRLKDLSAPIMLCGHSHIPRCVQIPNGRMIINPGSVGLPAYNDDGAEPYIIENGSPHARYAILENIAGKWTVDFRLVPYDHLAAAVQADSNHRIDWEIALRTGYMSESFGDNPPEVIVKTTPGRKTSLVRL